MATKQHVASMSIDQQKHQVRHYKSMYRDCQTYSLSLVACYHTKLKI